MGTAVQGKRDKDGATKRPPTTHAGATAELAEAGCKPKDRYPGRTSIPFDVLCLVKDCPGSKTPFSVYLSQVRALLLKGDSACPDCRKRRRANERRADMITRGRILPMEVIDDVKQPVRGWCMRCWKVVTKPRLDNIRSRQGGCEHCGGKARFTEEEARAIAAAWGYKPDPAIPYENDTTKWPGTCIAKDHYCEPHLNMRFHCGPCNACAENGFKPHMPALLYVVIKHEVEAAQIGICEDGPYNGRLAEHRCQGWNAYRAMHFPLGRDAHNVEQAIKKSWRARGWERVLDNGLGYSGYTESVSLCDTSVPDIWSEIRALAPEGLAESVYPSGAPPRARRVIGLRRSDVGMS